MTPCFPCGGAANYGSHPLPLAPTVGKRCVLWWPCCGAVVALSAVVAVGKGMSDSMNWFDVNPENAEALSLAVAKADAVGADLVLATDPDADRMGVAVRGPDGEMVLLTGNQIGTLLAEYRMSTLKEANVLLEALGCR